MRSRLNFKTTDNSYTMDGAFAIRQVSTSTRHLTRQGSYFKNCIHECRTWRRIYGHTVAFDL